MYEKNIFLFCASFVTIIITRAQSQQQWPYYNNCQNKPYGIINHLHKPPYQAPVISSKKIDVAIDQRVKPFYWSTLLPTPNKGNLEPIENQYSLESANQYKTVTNSDDYYTKVLLEYMKDVNTAKNVYNRAEKPLINELSGYKEVKPAVKKIKENNQELKQPDYYSRKQIQESNLNLLNQDKNLSKKNDQYKQEVNKKDGKSVRRKHKQFAGKNKEIAPKTTHKHCQSSSNPPKQKKSNKIEPEECKCRTRKPYPQKRDHPRKIDNNIKEPATDIGYTEKCTNFDQKCSDINDILNINLEYCDCDCECRRNSRNNDIKEHPKKFYDVPNDFPKDYLNLIYNLLPYQNLGYFYPDSNYLIPYNFDYLYQIPKYKNKKGNKNESKKSKNRSDKSKKDSNKKSLNKKRKKNKDNTDNCNSVIELSPTIISLNHSDEVFDNPATSKYVINLDSTDKVVKPLPFTTLLPDLDIKDLIKKTEERDEDSLEVTNEPKLENIQENTHIYPNRGSGELIIPLLPVDASFWDDYYPDFTLDNGAYITSSEEEEWFNFHKYFYSNSVATNKDILKRNLNKKPKSKPDLKINTHTRPQSTTSSFKNPNTEIKYKPSNLDYPDFITKIVSKDYIPSYKDILSENNKKANNVNNQKNNYKIQDIETIFAPSKVRNYSYKNKFEGINESSEESLENKLYVREGDLTVVYSAPFMYT